MLRVPTSRSSSSAPASWARERLAIAPFPVPLGTIETDGTGRFIAVADGLAAGRYRVLIEDAGDFGRWPARWAEEVTVP